MSDRQEYDDTQLMTLAEVEARFCEEFGCSTRTFHRVFRPMVQLIPFGRRLEEARPGRTVARPSVLRAVRKQVEDVIRTVKDSGMQRAGIER